MKEIRLFTPGPTPVPEAVRAALALPMIHHRSPEFASILAGTREALARLCDCDGEVALLASSGTGGMEAAVASLFGPGDEVAVVQGGKFGGRWVELARQYGLSARVIEVEWGRAVEAGRVLRTLTAQTKGVLLQACESSTGACHPVAEIGRALAGREDVLLVADAITALGIDDLNMRRDRIDVLIGASQKALMCPPGLAVVALSRRALERLEAAPPRSYYFSLARELKAEQKGQTAFTPAISLVRGLNAALAMIEREGKAALVSRHRLLKEMARAAFRADGFRLLNPDEEAAPGITAVRGPEGLELKAWLRELKDTHGLWLAGGQGKLEGKIFRVSHMGHCSADDLLWAIEKIEESAARLLPNAARKEGLRAAARLRDGAA